MQLVNSTPIDRRQWLRHAGMAGLGAAGLGTAAVPLQADPLPVPRPRPRDPQEALRRLMEGNERFVGGALGQPLSRSMSRLRELEAKQTPFASILACADSRVPPEILFDQGFGDLFVARVAGNIATSEVIGSLEYASQLLGAQLVMVLGHTACGAVSATVQGEAVPGQIGSLFPYIHPAAEEVSEDTPGAGRPPIPEVIEQNVRHQANILREASPVLKDLIAAGRLAIVGGVFHFRTGRVELLDADAPSA